MSSCQFQRNPCSGYLPTHSRQTQWRPPTPIQLCVGNIRLAREDHLAPSLGSSSEPRLADCIAKNKKEKKMNKKNFVSRNRCVVNGTTVCSERNIGAAEQQIQRALYKYIVTKEFLLKKYVSSCCLWKKFSSPALTGFQWNAMQWPKIGPTLQFFKTFKNFVKVKNHFKKS